MANVAIPYHVDAALERGLEGRGIARKDALSLMEEAPLAALAPDGWLLSGTASKAIRSAIPEKSSFHSPTCVATIAAIARSVLIRKPVCRRT